MKIQVPPPDHVKFDKQGRAYADMETLVEEGLHERIKEAIREKNFWDELERLTRNERHS